MRLLLAVGRGLLALPRPLAAVLLLSWMGLIWLASAQEGVPDAPFDPFYAFVYNLGHAPLFGLLGLWATLLLPRRDGWPVLEGRAPIAILASVVAWGALDELHQLFVSHRDPSILDLVTDAVGTACTLSVIAYLGRAEASDGGLRQRLGVGVLLCVLAGALSTWLPFLWGGGG